MGEGRAAKKEAGEKEAGEVFTCLAHEVATLRGELAAARRALQGAREEAVDLRRERERLLDLLARQEATPAQAAAPSAPLALPLRLRERLTALAARLPWLRPASAEAAPAPVPDDPPEPPPLVPYARDGLPPRPVIVAAVQGLTAAELERLVAAVQAQTGAAGVHVVFLTDCPELTLFRRRRAIVEYLPPAGELERMRPPQEVRLYLARRLELLRRKWRPVRILPYGEAAAAWLSGVAELPEAAPVRPLVGALEEPA